MDRQARFDLAVHLVQEIPEADGAIRGRGCRICFWTTMRRHPPRSQ
jgi:hypothetical protein